MENNLGRRMFKEITRELKSRGIARIGDEEAGVLGVVRAAGAVNKDTLPLSQADQLDRLHRSVRELSKVTRGLASGSIEFH